MDSIVPSFHGSRFSVFQQGSLLSGNGFTHDVWDHYVYSPLILTAKDGSYLMFYTGFDYTGEGEASSQAAPCVATSDDLINWTKPNLGYHTFAGNTNNNILIVTGSRNVLCDVIYTEETYFLLLKSSTDSAFIYESPTGGIDADFTYTGLTAFKPSTHTSHVAGTEDDYLEPKSLLFIDGKYRAYYSEGHVPQKRSIGYYEWDGPLADGTPVDQGLIAAFTSTNSNHQFYDIFPFKFGDYVWGVVPRYNASTDVLGPLLLYRSADGVTWHKAGTLLPNGDSGEFDFGLIAAAKPFLVEGVWRLFYAASDTKHNVISQTLFAQTAVDTEAAAQHLADIPPHSQTED